MHLLHFITELNFSLLLLSILLLSVFHINSESFSVMLCLLETIRIVHILAKIFSLQYKSCFYVGALFNHSENIWCILTGLLSEFQMMLKIAACLWVELISLQIVQGSHFSWWRVKAQYSLKSSIIEIPVYEHHNEQKEITKHVSHLYLTSTLSKLQLTGGLGQYVNYLCLCTNIMSWL